MAARVEFPDIVVYLLSGETNRLQESGSLQLLCERLGWYNKINCEFCVIIAAVRPSQRLSDKPHRPWVGLR